MTDNSKENADSEDSRKWIRQAQSGDLVAFEKIVRAEQDRVRAYLAVRLSRSWEAEDLAQEVFIIAFGKLNEFDPSRRVGPWLIGIAHNLLRNHLRKFRAEPIGGSEELQLALDAYHERSEPEQDRAPVIVALGECLEALPSSSRKLVTARYVNGESIKELRKETGRGHSSLTMQLHRIRTALMTCVERKLNPSS